MAHGQLDWGLRNDDRVHVIERTNAREIEPVDLPFEPSLATVDVSFISLAKVLPAVAAALAPDGELLAMVKPQFELGRKRVKGGVVRHAAERREALLAVAAAARELGLAIHGFASSGLPGPKGNRETFVWCSTGGAGLSDAEVDRDGARGGAVSPAPKTISVLTHTQPEQTSAAVRAVAEAASAAGCQAGCEPRGAREARRRGRRYRPARGPVGRPGRSVSCWAATGRS